MRRCITSFGNVMSRSGSIVNLVSFQRIACLTALVGGLALAQGFAKEPAEPEARPGSKIKSGNPSAPAAEAMIPACIEKLKLTQSQQAHAKDIVHKYDAELDKVWKQFGDKYIETVRTEVELLAAIEDNLTEQQRTQVREQRRRVAHAEIGLAGTSSKPSRATGKPADAGEQAAAGIGISLTDEQEAAADATQQKYVGRLRSLNRDIQGLHNRLVSLEADKLVELEKLLTKEQLAELREARLNGVTKITAADKPATKPE